MNPKEETALKILNRHIQILSKKNFHFSEPVKNEYSYQVSVGDGKEKILLNVFYGKKGNKIVLQGNKDLALFKRVSEIIFGEKLIDDVKPESEPDYPYIGTDESGKGDYFGPLVIAGVYVTQETGKYLRALGIRDSKELSDQQIKQFASTIKKLNEIIYDVVLISPEKYNQLYGKMGNLNRLMGWAHARVIENLLNKCDAGEAISDKFGNEKLILDALQHKGRSINLTQITKAEKFTAVAAASILARESVIKWFNSQSKKYKVKIPKGSSSEVENAAKSFLDNYGNEILGQLVKLHFKTSNKIFSK
ncbi:MAG: ribonuclease HIII [Ignavibacteria bacterium]|nr:ribonuclease HIII [Ignavibacteria bacterium]